MIILATIAIDLNLAFDIAAVSGMKLLTGIIALCLGIAWIVFKSLQWAAAPPQITFEPRPKELEIPKTVEAKPAKSIVVLPFKNMSADPEQEYFCEGLAEELINAFAKIQDLRVVARTSALHFKGKDLGVREIGRRLNVETVLEGSVRKSGNRLRISAQLINVADGYYLWSERFDRELDDHLAETHEFLGLISAYFEWNWENANREFKRAFEVHDIWMYNIKTDFLMDNIREDARFKPVLKKMNLT